MNEPSSWPSWFVVIICVGLSTCGSRLRGDEWRADAKRLWERGVASQLRLSRDERGLELEQGELFEDDGPAAGFSYKPNEEQLSATTWIKKELIIPNPQARQATLLVGSGGELQAIINGRPQSLEKQGKAGNYWERYTFNSEALVPGKNEIVLFGKAKLWIARAEDFAAGSTTRTQHPQRSAKSVDQGQTWSREKLGKAGDVEGEYYVRVFLDHSRSRGTLTLPVVDVGNLADEPLALPLKAVGPVQLNVDAETPAKTEVQVQVRRGTTTVPDDEHWSKWEPLAGETITPAGPTERYLQVRIELATNDPLVSPRLQEVILTARPEPASTWPRQVKVVEQRNPRVVRSAIPFEYEAFDQAQLKRLRQQYRLDEVVAGAKSEWELVCKLAAWSSQQWNKGHLGQIYPAWDALEILKPHADGKPIGGFCQQYNLVFLQACESFGLTGRAVSLGSGDHGVNIRSGHEVVEIWSHEFEKWVYIDGNAAWYFVDAATKRPLSLWELRQRQLQAFRQLSNATQTVDAVEVVTLADSPYTWKDLTSWPPFAELRLIPRSNFLGQKAPLPLHQGMRGWFWTGHHVWSDEASPASLLYGQRVSQRSNWDWTLDQAQIVLEALPAAGQVRVQFDSQTPGFQAYVVHIDGKKLEPVAGALTWKLKPGKNRLEVRTRNSAGREGSASFVVLEYRE